jgi:hypothetical protein
MNVGSEAALQAPRQSLPTVAGQWKVKYHMVDDEAHSITEGDNKLRINDKSLISYMN